MFDRKKERICANNFYNHFTFTDQKSDKQTSLAPVSSLWQPLQTLNSRCSSSYVPRRYIESGLFSRVNVPVRRTWCHRCGEAYFTVPILTSLVSNKSKAGILVKRVHASNTNGPADWPPVSRTNAPAAPLCVQADPFAWTYALDKDLDGNTIVIYNETWMPHTRSDAIKRDSKHFGGPTS